MRQGPGLAVQCPLGGQAHWLGLCQVIQGPESLEALSSCLYRILEQHVLVRGLEHMSVNLYLAQGIVGPGDAM